MFRILYLSAFLPARRTPQPAFIMAAGTFLVLRATPEGLAGMILLIAYTARGVCWQAMDIEKRGLPPTICHAFSAEFFIRR
ncbi:MAG: hypothetical protein U0X87_16830 [Anaerolineales bacterium]